MDLHGGRAFRPGGVKPPPIQSLASALTSAGAGRAWFPLVAAYLLTNLPLFESHLLGAMTEDANCGDDKGRQGGLAGRQYRVLAHSAANSGTRIQVLRSGGGDEYRGVVFITWTGHQPGARTRTNASGHRKPVVRIRRSFSKIFRDPEEHRGMDPPELTRAKCSAC
jgi:hypothetical protein